MVAPIRSNEARARIDDRRMRVAELMLNGYSERSIAQRVGVVPSLVHKDVVAIREQWAGQRNATYQEHVARQMARLNQLERVIARKVAEGDLEAVDRAIKILDRRARLLGLDAPTKHEVQVDDPITAEIQRLAAQLGVMDDPAVRQVLTGAQPVVLEVVGADRGATSTDTPTTDQPDQPEVS